MHCARFLGLAGALLAATLAAAGPATDSTLPPEPASRADAAAAAVPDAATLEAAHARIGTITIRTHQIFDVTDPQESKALYRAANALHARTRESAIRAQLLFHSGDPYSGRLLEETERNLRQLRYLREPRIRVTAWHDGVVDVTVDTYDVWTLQFGPSFGRSGGTNSTGAGVKDDNLFGTGKELAIGWSSNVDRHTTFVTWFDPNLLGSHWTDAIGWYTSSDGYSHAAQVALPFYQLASTHSYSVLISDTVQTDTRYRLGLSYDDYQHDIRTANAYVGWSSGLMNGRVWRWSAGWQVQQDNFLVAPGDTLMGPLPANRHLAYPYVSLQLVSDAFQTTLNENLIARTEDLQLGWNGVLQLGWSAPLFGGDRDAGIVSGQLSYGQRLPVGLDEFATASLSSRIENGQTVDAHIALQNTLYWHTSRRTLAYLLLSGDSGQRVDLDHYDLLGGDSGLRGYPLRYQMGTSRALLTAEERVYTPWSLWRLLDIGGAVFFDTGRTWGSNPVSDPQLGWLSDAGIGLRLGNNRSSLGSVIHVDLATPLNSRDPNVRGLQLLVSTQATF